MNKTEDMAIITAMMLLEIGAEGEFNPEYQKYGGVHKLANAAHSFLQISRGGMHSCDYAEELLAQIQTDSAIENAIFMSKHHD